MDKAKEHILARIRQNKNSKRITACEQSIVAGESVYKPIEPDAPTCFKQELDAINGHCELLGSEQEAGKWLSRFIEERGIPYLYCRDVYLAGLLASYGIPVSCNQVDFSAMQAGITGCEFLVARTGSVIMSSALPSGRQMHGYAPVHIVWAYTNQLVDYPADAYEAMQAKYGNDLPSSITTVTGPSRTADIEKTLVLGAHGPKELHVLLIAGAPGTKGNS